MILSYLSHSFSNAFCVFGEMSLSSSSTFLWVVASAGDFRKSSFFFMKGFSKSSVIYSCHCSFGIQLRSWSWTAIECQVEGQGQQPPELGPPG